MKITSDSAIDCINEMFNQIKNENQMKFVRISDAKRCDKKRSIEHEMLKYLVKPLSDRIEDIFNYFLDKSIA